MHSHTVITLVTYTAVMLWHSSPQSRWMSYILCYNTHCTHLSHWVSFILPQCSDTLRSFQSNSFMQPPCPDIVYLSYTDKNKSKPLKEVGLNLKILLTCFSFLTWLQFSSLYSYQWKVAPPKHGTKILVNSLKTVFCTKWWMNWWHTKQQLVSYRVHYLTAFMIFTNKKEKEP